MQTTYERLQKIIVSVKENIEKEKKLLAELEEQLPIARASSYINLRRKMMELEEELANIKDVATSSATSSASSKEKGQEKEKNPILINKDNYDTYFEATEAFAPRCIPVNNNKDQRDTIALLFSTGGKASLKDAEELLDTAIETGDVSIPQGKTTYDCARFWMRKLYEYGMIQPKV